MSTPRMVAGACVLALCYLAPSTPAQSRPGAPASAPATAGGQGKAGATFPADQLDQLVAPIALYPDGLLMQILMSATYPLEVVQAERWISKNPNLTGKALEEALKKQEWDAAVKSLCGFPDVLKRMSANLDWTQDLGDAFLGQQKEVLDACQRMRKIASESGNLKTTEQQKVTIQEDKTIVIQPANPEVIYVPTYSPTVVYTGWYCPAPYYPPMYSPPGYGLLAFGVGMAWGAAIWGGCNWGGGDVNIDIDRQTNFNRNTNIDGGARPKTADNRAGGKGSWQHDASHRQGVNYRDSATAKQFGGKDGSSRVSRDAARGYGGDRAGAGNLQARTPTAGQQPARTGGAGAGARDTARPSAQPSARPSTGASSSSKSGALSGSRSPSLDRAASSRGASSRGASGGSRSGGGARGGGGGRR